MSINGVRWRLASATVAVCVLTATNATGTQPAHDPLGTDVGRVAGADMAKSSPVPKSRGETLSCGSAEAAVGTVTEARQRLSAALNRFENAHTAIMHGDAERGIAPETDPGVKHAWARTDVAWSMLEPFYFAATEGESFTAEEQAWVAKLDHAVRTRAESLLYVLDVADTAQSDATGELVAGLDRSLEHLRRQFDRLAAADCVGRS